MNVRRRRSVCCWASFAALAVVAACGKETAGPIVPVALTLVSGNGQSGTVGQALANALVVRVSDASGAGLPGVTVAWSARSGGGTLSASNTTTDQSGQSLVTLTLGTAAVTDTVSAAVAQLTPVLFAAAAVAGPPAKLVFPVQPGNVTAGAAISPAVQVAVQDAFGNTATAAATTVAVAITSGTGTAGATLSGTLSKPAASGVAAFADLAIDKAGTGYTLTATAAGLPSVATAAFAVSAGAAAKLAFTVQPANTTAGAAISPAVQVTVLDAEGNAVTNATNTIALAITGGTGAAGATLGGSLTQAAASGIAAFSSLTIDKAASGYTLTSSAAGLASGTSATFTISAGPAAGLAKQAGDSQTATIGTAVPIPPAVLVTDVGHNPVSGVQVTFAVASGGGTVDLATPVMTNGSGVAAVTSWTLGQTPGANTLRAASIGLSGSPLAFTATGTPSYAGVVSAGMYHTCALTPSGAAYCWGWQIYGTMGNGSADTGHVLTPNPVAGGLTFDSLTAGGYHACALTQSGVAYCWGSNYQGELGIGLSPQNCQNNPGAAPLPCATVPTPVAGDYEFVSISAGAYHTCGLTASGAAYCWGLNRHGQLGTGDTLSTSTPVVVSGGLSFAAISAGDETTCGVTTTGVGYCWGWNNFGMVGNSSQIDRLVPTSIAGGVTFAAIKTSGYHTCGVTTDGSAYCWGLDNYGQLGAASTPGSCIDPTNPIYSYPCSTVPAPVSGGLPFRLVIPVADATCGLLTSGAAYCWGSGSSGVLGNGSITPSALPPGPVSGGLLFQRLAGGGNWFYCAISTAGVTYCWGDGSAGQLGNGATAEEAVPTRVVNLP